MQYLRIIVLLTALVATRSAFSQGPIGVLMTKTDTFGPAIEDRYIVSKAFPQAWVTETYAKHFHIYDVWNFGGTWVLLAKKGLGWGQQTLKINPPDDIIADFQRDGYIRTAFASDGAGTNLLVFTSGTGARRWESFGNVLAHPDTPDQNGWYVVNIKHHPEHTVRTRNAYWLIRESNIVQFAPWSGVSSQEIALRTDPNPFLQSAWASDRRITSYERAGRQFLIVATGVNERFEQQFLPLDDAKIQAHEQQGFRITSFY